MWKSSQSSETSRVIVLFLGHTSIFMKLQTQGYGIPCVQMWSQEGTDCLCRAYFNARHEGALFKVNRVRRCRRKLRKVQRDIYSDPPPRLVRSGRRLRLYVTWLSCTHRFRMWNDRWSRKRSKSAPHVAAEAPQQHIFLLNCLQRQTAGLKMFFF